MVINEVQCHETIVVIRRHVFELGNEQQQQQTTTGCTTMSSFSLRAQHGTRARRRYAVQQQSQREAEGQSTGEEEDAKRVERQEGVSEREGCVGREQAWDVARYLKRTCH